MIVGSPNSDLICVDPLQVDMTFLGPNYPQAERIPTGWHSERVISMRSRLLVLLAVMLVTSGLGAAVPQAMANSPTTGAHPEVDGSLSQGTVTIAPTGNWTYKVIGVIHAPTSDGGPGGWQRQDTPSEGKLSGLSCPTITFCMAVGTDDLRHPLVYKWDGETWSIEDTPRLPVRGHLYGVSCPTTQFCQAVGERSKGRTLAEMWNGSQWQIEDSPTTRAEALLAGVSCPSTQTCIAVGYAGPDYGDTLAELWDGSTWSIQQTPNPFGGGHLASVSCVSVSSCVAVGSPGSQPLAEEWTGQRGESRTHGCPGVAATWTECPVSRSIFARAWGSEVSPTMPWPRPGTVPDGRFNRRRPGGTTSRV